jgi:hypothetical protein
MSSAKESVQLGLFDRFRGGLGRRGSSALSDPAADVRYLRQWVAEHSGVEGYVEPETTVTDLTVVLIAGDGEWTRRRTGGEAGARRLAGQLKIPVYDVQKVGYPQRMRDYDARRRIERRRAAGSDLEDR